MTVGTRLRPTPDADGLAVMYPKPHDHRIYGAGHDLRVKVTAALGRWLADDCQAATVADLSAGVGAIARAMVDPHGARLILGDIAPGHPLVGPIEDTLAELDPVDVFICTETLEHIDDPAGVLATVRAKARRLLVSFPHCDELDANTEHVWQWTPDEARTLLACAGWDPVTWATLEVPDGPYSYSIVGCR